ncbi:NhaA family Na+:H+ antiporter [Pedobacter cryoconitis]|uniref:Na(+)/H(+) antiporter NhaA n=1 Tax=Pedobacter cryoconitis TaxID=188932 RepID=A0A7W9DLZ4_9SPHI|nr:Na+/H+ antiporter NhaA [Pedobacter cryoconitis]MBB5622660.1 NhaA family Na+:H+ antiporter [Pedobacter cryoconitis]MBB5648813.1 NhaA family Na+:H+ antiporter [Pedobacter cryoconitis]
MELIPKSPFEKIIAPVSKFIHLEYTGGIVLFLSVIIAIVWANSPFHESYHHLWDIKFSIGFDSYVLNKPLHIWINDGLMALFFFVIGLELKREFMEGELSTLKKASLPMMAALGGMLIPAAIFFVINKGLASEHGWGIPMATDIAFALALLSMAGKHIPGSVKVFLSALAVADDLGAVLVIAFFYTSNLNFVPLGIAAIFLLILIAGNKLGIRSTAFYLLIGIAVWIGFLLSGVHATIAGVLVAFTIPAVTKINENSFSENLRKLSADFENEIPNSGLLTTSEQHRTIEQVKSLTLAAETPLQKIEYALHPWVAFVIMPLFALANAGIIIGADFFSALVNPVSIGVISGLIIGKFAGVLLFTWLMVKTGLAQLPDQANWKHITGVALLAGVGFTMSLFISNLAFEQPEFIDQAKYGILIASLIAGILGITLLKSFKKA